MSANNFNKRELLKYTGDYQQVLGVRDYTLNGGKAQGVRAIDVRNGSGLEFTVLPDRGMDIAWLSYRGTNCSYISKTGIVAPQYYSDDGADFLRSFHAGLFTTCGLRNVGSPGVDEGEELGLHGRISNIPAEEVSYDTEWIDGQAVIRLKGRLREAKLFGENMILSREISCICGESKIKITDHVENYGFRKEPLMLLYHFNLGYPLLDENACFEAPSKAVRARDEEAEKGISTYKNFQKPTPGYAEQVFYHDLRSDAQGNTCAALLNDRLEMGAVIRFNKQQLFNLVQWKQPGEGEYVLGIEPGNCYVQGRQDARERGVLEYIDPGEIRSFELEVEIVEGKTDLNRIRSEIAGI